MSPGSVSRAVVTDKIAVVRRMFDAIGTLPLQRFDDFSSDPRRIVNPRSCLGFGKVPEWTGVEIEYTCGTK